MNDGTITLRAFVRPGTAPARAPGASLIPQIAELHRFGLLPAGSQVWANFDLPGSLWILADRSSYLRIIDVPVSGWVNLRGRNITWAMTHDQAVRKTPRATARTTARIDLSRDEMPVHLEEEDLFTVAFRNADAFPMRARVGNLIAPQDLQDWEITYSTMRAIDFKVGGDWRRSASAEPGEYDIHHAFRRGLDLLCCTSEKRYHRALRDNLDAVTTHLDPELFDRIMVQHNKIADLSERVFDPIMHNLADLGGFALSKRERRTESTALAPAEDQLSGTS